MPDDVSRKTTARAEGRRRRRGAVGKATFYLLIVVLGLLVGTALRLTRDPIALPDWVVARVEARIGGGLASHAVTLGEVALAYDLEAQALRLRLLDAALLQGGRAIVSLPEARVALDGAALLRGEVRPRQVAVEGLALDVSRDADGRFSLAFGQGGGALPGSWPEALDTLDAALATPIVAGLTDVDVEDVRVRFEDAVTGLSQVVEDGHLEWRRDGDAVRLSLASALRLGGSVARVTAALDRDPDETAGGARARIALSGLSLGGLAEALPGVPALTLVRGEAAATAEMRVSGAGEPGPLTGRVEVSDVSATDRPRLALDRAVLAFDWLPGSGRIGLSEIAGTSDEMSLAASGQILLEKGLVGPVQVQLRLGETVFDPEGLFDRRVAFSSGALEARITQRPLSLHLGQAVVSGPSGTARASGRLTFPPEGIAGSLSLSVPRMAVGDLAALWPRDLMSGSREWFTTNMLAGTATQAQGLLRLEPGRPPEVAASFGVEAARFRYMRDMPPAEEVSGAAQLDGDRLTLRLDAGVIPALGPESPRDPATGRIDVAGTTFVIDDTRARPPRGELELRATGEIGDLLTVLDNPPFELLERLGKGPDLANGRVTADVSVRLPLRAGNAPADISYDVSATLTDVESRALVPGRAIAAERLRLSVDAERVEIAGDATFEGVPFTGRWRQALPPPATSASASEDEAPRALPEPGRVTGVARIDPAGLDRLGISIAALELDGATEARLDVTLPQGGEPEIRVESDLAGLSAALPAIGWRKSRGRAAPFALEATLGAVPEVTSMRLDAPGLDATGQVTLRADGSLDRARFDRVDTGWFRGPVTLTGRGPGAMPAIAIEGGTADLRQALLSAGGGSGEGGPLDIALSRLTISEGIALTDLRASLPDSSGSFTGRINGGAAIAGRIAPDAGGSAVQISGNDAGGVLQSAGLFEDARGGTITMTLRPTPRTGEYAGQVRMSRLRVRNAPALASLLQTLSVVGILEQLTGEGLYFETVETDFTLRPDDILVRRASAVGPSMSITADGAYDLGTMRMDMQGVVSPIYLVNGLFGALFGQRDEGLFGFTYRLTGPAADPDVSVNPLSILTPGAFRDVFRKPPPS
ncbi:AsmA-like C-terminal region-containing protein [uncultured Jannaschia sp.]|uniref:AsmA-like C-terminal region-containing protein n=1 Tax=uncultured Jannaschia sp. TaxID=293347 RepID=UPI00263824ED|nr:AsmA-like C-terminal region-containing protein [uncultured Jannaschia sp.]